MVRRGDIAAVALGDLGSDRSGMGVGVEPVDGLLRGSCTDGDVGCRIAGVCRDRWDAQSGEAVGISGRMEQDRGMHWIVKVSHKKRRFTVSDESLQRSDGPVGLLDPGGLPGLPFDRMSLIGEMGG